MSAPSSPAPTAAPASSAKAPTPSAPTPFGRLRHWAINIVALAIAAICCWLYYADSLIYPATDDAYIQADFVAVAPQISGPAVEIAVRDNQFVHTGDLLLQIDPRPFALDVQSAQVALDQAGDTVRALEQAVEAAKSNVTDTEAALLLTKQTRDRAVTLSGRGAFSRQDLDDAIARFNESAAKVEVARSNLSEAQRTLGEPGDNNPRLRAARTTLATAQLNLEYTTIRATVNGYVTSLTIPPGNYLRAGVGVFAIVDDASWRTVAHVQETQLRNVKPGQQVSVLVKAYPGHHFRGVVQGIGRGIFDPDNMQTTDLLPNISPTLDWVRLAQRFPVRILFTERDPAFPLRIGQSAYIVIDTPATLVPIPETKRATSKQIETGNRSAAEATPAEQTKAAAPAEDTPKK